MALTAAVVGTSFGARVHVPALRAAGFEVIALVGRDAEKTQRRAARAEVPKAPASLGEALELAPDVVTIATPPPSHAALAHEAIVAGCHVICEKPFASNAAEARSLAAAAETAGIVGYVGNEFRWAPQRALITRAIDDGLVGELRLLLFTSFYGLVADPQVTTPDWWLDVGEGGGWLGALGSHSLDQIRLWAGDITSVSASLALVSGRDVTADDTFTISFRSASGAEGVIVETAAAWGPVTEAVRIVGSAGTLWIEGDAVHHANGNHPEGRRLELPPDLLLPPGPAPGRGFTHLELPLYSRLAESFRDAVEGGPHRAGPRAATFADGAAVMAIMDASRASAADGGAWTEVK